jgi:hypothetical protein
MVSDMDSVPGVWPHTAAGDDYRFVITCDMRNNFTFSLIPKKSTNDDRAAHCNIK